MNIVIVESRVSRNSICPQKLVRGFSHILTCDIFLASLALAPNVQGNEFRHIYNALPPVNGLAGLVVIHDNHLNCNGALRQTHKPMVGLIVLASGHLNSLYCLLVLG